MFAFNNALSLLIGILILILVILAVLMPFFVFQIRDYTLRIKKEIIKTNETLSLLNDNISGIYKTAIIVAEIQKGIPSIECSWCHGFFPSSQMEKFKDGALCSDCAHKRSVIKQT